MLIRYSREKNFFTLLGPFRTRALECNFLVKIVSFGGKRNFPCYITKQRTGVGNIL